MTRTNFLDLPAQVLNSTDEITLQGADFETWLAVRTLRWKVTKLRHALDRFRLDSIRVAHSAAHHRANIYSAAKDFTAAEWGKP